MRKWRRTEEEDGGGGGRGGGRGGGARCSRSGHAIGERLLEDEVQVLARLDDVVGLVVLGLRAAGLVQKHLEEERARGLIDRRAVLGQLVQADVPGETREICFCLCKSRAPLHCSFSVGSTLVKEGLGQRAGRGRRPRARGRG